MTKTAAKTTKATTSKAAPKVKRNEGPVLKPTTAKAQEKTPKAKKTAKAPVLVSNPGTIERLSENVGCHFNTATEGAPREGDTIYLDLDGTEIPMITKHVKTKKADPKITCVMSFVIKGSGSYAMIAEFREQNKSAGIRW